MRTHRWMLLTVVLVVSSATPAAGQDLTFLQAADAATQIAREAGVPLTAPRYINATAFQAAFERARMPVPSVAELREALERDEPDKPRIIVVDSGADMVERGQPDDPRLQGFAARAGWQPTADAPAELTWVAGDGVIISPSVIERHGDEYHVRYFVSFNVSGMRAGNAPKIVRVATAERFVKRDGEWVALPPEWVTPVPR